MRQRPVRRSPYTAFAQIYDELMRDVPYPEWARYALERIGDVVPPRPEGWRLLDLACGTGRVTAELVRLGHRVTGVDRSAAMLSVARRRVPEATFKRADLRRFRVPEPVDACLCLYDSLNYLPDAEALRAAFHRVRGAVRAGGVFVFDLNSPARLAAIRTGIERHDGDGYTLFWRNRYLPAARAWEARLTCYEQGARGRVRRWEERHLEYAHEPRDVLDALHAAGFEAEGPYRHGTCEPAAGDDGRLAFVAVAAG